MKTNLNQLALLPLIGISVLTSCKEEKRPNILFAIADDMSYGHTGYDGYPEVKTPAFDRIAGEGIVFTRAYTSSPSCSPSRASILTGKNGYELEEGAVLFSFLPKKFETYPEILRKNGYHTGFTGKGWGPGDIKIAGREENPAGKEYNMHVKIPDFAFGPDPQISKFNYFENFRQFLSEKPADQPFCFWYGAQEPHRDYLLGTGELSGKDPSKVEVPGFLVNNESVQSDILDYLFEIEWYDANMLKMLNYLDSIGELENTIVVMTSDNGMPFPRAKSNLYEYGVHLPLAIRWGKNEPRVIDDFISFPDFAPTFLNAAGIPVPETMTGKSFYEMLKSKESGQTDPERNSAVVYKERHAWVLKDGQCIPSRGYRKDNWLLIWNLNPDQWPAGDPDPVMGFLMWPFGDVDDGPAKIESMKQKNVEGETDYFALAFEPRPQYELYDVVKDPFQLHNLASDPQFTETLNSLSEELKEKLTASNDPRMTGTGIEHFTNAPYFGIKTFETGWTQPRKWEKMTQEEKDNTIKEKLLSVDKVKASLQELYNDPE